MSEKSSTENDLLSFALAEYDRRQWGMPDVHVRIFDWLERTDGQRTRVLRVFRGCGKSTILGIRNAHKYRKAPRHQLLVQGADDDLAHDVSRDTLSVLQNHPWCRGIVAGTPGTVQWWTVKGWENNRRTPSFRGKGILSRVTGNRADEIQNDDVEVEKNVSDDKARKKLRKKLSEQTHILKPGGSRLYVGTPHTHDSLYDQLIAGGAEHLTIPLFATQDRHQGERLQRLPFHGDARDVWVFVGIGNAARLLAGHEYKVVSGHVVLATATGATVDVCTGNAWPERFHRTEMNERRRECLTLNEWDSQYQLEAKPIHEMRLDPARMVAYDLEPEFRQSNRNTTMWLGGAQIVGCSLWWDPSSGKVGRDVSSAALDFQDATGYHYLHRMLDLQGVIAETTPDGKRITGGQVWQLCDAIEKFRIQAVNIETNGVGAHVAAFMRMILKQRRIGCVIREHTAMANKAKRILGAWEPLLESRMIWAHVSVLNGPLWDQMKDWNPVSTDQPDDLLDSGAGAFTAQPARIGQSLRNLEALQRDDWRPNSGVYEVAVEH